MLVTEENAHKVLDFYAQEKPEYLAVDTETTGLRWERDRMFLIIIAWGDERSFVFPQETWATAQALLHTEVPKVFHNAKFDLHFLESAGLSVRGEIADTLILAQATGAIGKDKTLNKQLKTLGNHFCPDIDALTPKKNLDSWFRKEGVTKAHRDYSAVPMKIMEPYAKTDGIITHRLKPIFERQIEKVGTQRVSRIDHDLLPTIYRMERRGIRIDRDLAARQIADFTAQEADAQASLFQLAGEEFNPNSDEELKGVLQSHGFTPGKYVDVDALRALKKDDPLIEAVIAYRKITKILHTYLAPIYEFSAGNGRLHGSFNITGAYTGRLSSSSPNFQNFPASIRPLFLPNAGQELIFADFQQMELRVAAEYCRDPVMLRAFVGENPLDLHAETAQIIFPNLHEQDAALFKKWRNIGKQVNFSLIYGAGIRRVANIVGCNDDLGRRIKADVLDRYEIFNAWFRKVQGVMRQRGFITNRFGRRYEHVHGYEYRGPNYLVQGTCADMMKLALVRIDEELQERGMAAALLSNIHDEVVLSAPAHERGDVIEILTRHMTTWDELEMVVPMTIDVSVSQTNWAEKESVTC